MFLININTENRKNMQTYFILFLSTGVQNTTLSLTDLKLFFYHVAVRSMMSQARAIAQRCEHKGA